MTIGYIINLSIIYEIEREFFGYNQLLEVFTLHWCRIYSYTIWA